MNYQKLLPFIIASAYIAVSIGMGFLVKFFILKKLKIIFEKTQWKGDDLILHSINKIIIWCFVLTGLYLSIIQLPFPDSTTKEAHLALKIFSIIIITFFISNLTIGFVTTYSNKNQKLTEASSILIIVIRFIIYLTGTVIILDIIGLNITPILTAMGVGGLAVALAMQETLSNFFAGIQILISKNINTGDYICLENGEEGYITEITWRSTTIKSLSNKIIITPNSKLVASQIINFDLPDTENAVLIEIGVSYNSDLNKVEKVVNEVAENIMKTVEGGLPQFKPFIRYNKFSDSSINFNVILRAKKYSDQYLIKHEFIKSIHERFNKENIEIPFPIRTIKMS